MFARVFFEGIVFSMNTSCSTIEFYQHYTPNTIQHSETVSPNRKNNMTQTLGSCVLALPYLWRETIAACSFSFSACVVPKTCQAWKNTMEKEGRAAELLPRIQWRKCIVGDHSTIQRKLTIFSNAEESTKWLVELASMACCILHFTLFIKIHQVLVWILWWALCKE